MDSTLNINLTQQAQLTNLQIAGAISWLSISFQRYPDKRSLPANANTNLISPEIPCPCSSMRGPQYTFAPAYRPVGSVTKDFYAMRYSANTTHNAGQSPDTNTYSSPKSYWAFKGRPIAVLRLHALAPSCHRIPFAPNSSEAGSCRS